MPQPQVTFYILHNQARKSSYGPFIGQLADKIWHQGYRICIQTNSRTEAETLDTTLWTFRQDSFLAHIVHTPSMPTTLPTNIPTPVHISYTNSVANEFDVLINLAAQIPEFAGQFQRILEVVDDTATARENGRQRYRNYRQRGWRLETHDIYR